MKTYHEPARELKVVDEVDVLVVGGGSAGIAASIAAARNGARVLLVERFGFLGGNLTGQLLEGSVSFHGPTGDQIIGGIAQEIVERVMALGGSPGHVRDDTGYSSTRTPLNHEILKCVFVEMVHDAGVKILLQTMAVGVIVEDSNLRGVIIENKSGRTAIMAEVTIDCSGDADVCAMVGADFAKGRPSDGLTQPMSMLFKLGGIDFARVIKYVEDHPEDFLPGSDPGKDLSGRPVIHLWGYGRLLREARRQGLLSIDRAEVQLAGWTGQGEAIVNVTRYAADGTETAELSKAEIELRRQVLEFVAFFRDFVPGFEKSHLTCSASMVGVRESRRIVGEYMVTEEDVKNGARFVDAVAQAYFPIDIHDPKGSSLLVDHPCGPVDIPYRALVPKSIDRLLVAGRCVSATHRALGTLRLTAHAMAMGQAAGTAAALAAAAKATPRAIDISLLQEKLRQQGVILR